MSAAITDAQRVDAWLKQVTPTSRSLSADEALSLFDRALDAVCREACETLGEVTLSAIATRVLVLSKERFPVLSGLTFEGLSISLGTLAGNVHALRTEEIVEPLRFLLLELLGILGALTANVLTPWLHAELSKVALQPLVRKGAEEGPPSGQPVPPKAKKV